MRSILTPRASAVSPIVAAQGSSVIRIAMRAGRRRPGVFAEGIAPRGSRRMNVRDLACWPPRWRRVSNPSGEVTPGERGVLIAARSGITRPSPCPSSWRRRAETDRSQCSRTGAGANRADTPARLARRPTPCQDWRPGVDSLAPASVDSLLTTSAAKATEKPSQARPRCQRAVGARRRGWPCSGVMAGRRRPRAVGRVA